MKRILGLIILSVVICLTLVGCNSSSSDDHTHAYGEAWMCNGEKHWHPCTVAGCDVVADEAEHTFVENVCSVCAYERMPEPGLSFLLDEEGDGYIVDGIGTLSDVREIVIPATYNNLPVHRIGSGAFRNCSTMESITFSENITTVGEDAFAGCTSLVSVYIKDIPTFLSINFSYGGALQYATELYLGGELVRDFVIPEGVESVSDNLFDGYQTLESVTFPASLKTVGSSAFRDCTNLKKVTCFDIASWCEIQFSSGDSNPLYYAKALYVGEELLTNLVLPETLLKIPSYAFYHCESIVSVTIPDTVEAIGYGAFGGCTSLATTKDNGLNYIGNKNNPYLVLLSADADLTEATVHESCKVIHSSAFNPAKQMTSVQIAKNVVEIGQHAFLNCTALSDLKFLGGSDSRLRTIGESAFSGCVALENLEISSVALETVGRRAFHKCTGLKNVTFSNCDKLTTIGGYAFYQCESLASVVFEHMVDGNWLTIQECVFYECKALTTIKLPKKLKAIEFMAFYRCESLAYIEIPEYNKKIGASAFLNCKALKQVVFIDYMYYGSSSQMTSIEEQAFSGCSALESIVLPDSGRSLSVGRNAFYGCENLRTIYCSHNRGTAHHGWIVNTIDGSNVAFTEAELICYSETTPEGEGKFWHLNEDYEIVLWGAQE